MNDATRAVFLDETTEFLDTLEADLMHLESDPSDMDTVHSAFRALHTIKGSAGIVGYPEVSRFSHRLENLFDGIRTGNREVTSEVVDLGLAASDYLRELLAQGPGAQESPKGAEISRRLDAQLGSAETDDAQATVSAAPAKAAAEREHTAATYRVRFAPSQSILTNGTDPIRLINELRGLGTCLMFPVTTAVPDLDEIDPEACYTSWTICVTTVADENALRDVFIFVEDTATVEITLLDDGSSIDADTDYKRIGEILYERGDLEEEEIRQILGEAKPFGAIATDRGLVSSGSVESALEEQQHVRSLRSQRQDAVQSSTTRVANIKLDEMVNLVGELVTLQARLSQNVTDGETADLAGIAENLELVVARLRENAMSVRLVPLSDTFTSFNRLTRDLGRTLGKEVDLQTSGGDTELDKNVIALLRDPLMHIVRNAVDHGVESAEERVAAGKPRQATVQIDAEALGADVLIRISDDGKGLDHEKIHNRAVENGIVSPAASLTPQEIYGLIFQPGFSTAATATDVSGRGVGMDVVKKNIESLSGSVDVTSRPGAGTTVTLRIPLTLAIIDSLLVQVGDERYVINLSHVDECFIQRDDPLAGRKTTVVSRNTGEVLPFIDLRAVLDVPRGGPDIKNTVVVRDEDRKAAIVVDRIVGQYQSVIKNLDPTLRSIEEISGSTILGDGRVALILDVVKILRTLSAEA